MRRRFLNVGGGDKETEVPSIYDGWDHILLDIDPAVSPDICMDARELQTLNPGQFDAVYCSHNLEHYFPHDVKKVLSGFRHVLKEGGFAEIRVPDMGGLFKDIVSKNLDIDDLLYQSEDGPVLVRDVIYGFGPQIEQSGVDFYAHRTGFTRKSIRAAITQAGFLYGAFTSGRHLEIAVRAFKQKPTPEQMKLIGIEPSL
ncbi:MAG: class I SAM-dependent methyltransferase [Proteobacteria bacterium]|jgi:SAM-dependent methyltransferase|nr:class I SAM-dependent methyltransferase [Pseudomonadota bacterium]